MKSVKDKAQSPYQKYNKRPHKYSELYQRWRTAVLAGRTGEARRLGVEHSRRWLSYNPAAHAAAA